MRRNVENSSSLISPMDVLVIPKRDPRSIVRLELKKSDHRTSDADTMRRGFSTEPQILN